MKLSSIDDVSAGVLPLMNGFGENWCVAGGWAIDLFLGRVSRPHEDVEIAIFRPDQRKLRRHLSDWSFRKVIEGQPVNWPLEEELKLPIHEVHAQSRQDLSLSLEFLLNERSTDDWIYRRDARIRMPLESAIVRDACAVPLLSPAIVLLFKSKNHRTKDDLDFYSVRDVLGEEQRRWLAEALRVCCKAKHPWLDQLRITGGA